MKGHLLAIAVRGVLLFPINGLLSPIHRHYALFPGYINCCYLFGLRLLDLVA